MSLPDPATAPARTDLPYLRHRSRLRPAASSGAVADFFHGTAPRPPHRRAEPAVVPAPQPVSTQPVSTSLDLSTPAPAPARPVAPPRVARRLPPVERLLSGRPSILTREAPSVTLTRLQSGIGALTIEAACSPEIGDLRLGCAFQLVSGRSSTVQLADGQRFGPADASRPVIVAGRDAFERIAVDLRQVRELERLAVYAFSESSAELAWGGTLVTTTFGGGRVEVPIEAAAGGVLVLATAYVVAGELVLRRELERIGGSVRDACRSYGYDRISWLDDRRPLQ